MEMSKWPEAIRIYEGIRSRLGDRDAALLNNLAYAYGEQGQYDRAIPLAQKAWQLDKNNPATTDTLGWLLFKSGTDRARGLVLLEQAARGAPTDRQIQAHLNQAKKT
jgi:tetratricopeptide (TPR) repeat protein